MQNHLRVPGAAFLRIAQIIGNPNADPPIPALIPIGRSTWWLWVRIGKAPPSVKLGPRTTAWRADDIYAFVESFCAPDLGEHA